ncbi:MAG: hypothetical protein HLX51_01670 [Micrococcaceae bacterium]|nr:hypothetical protein [Micrococcaceae bacterium]
MDTSFNPLGERAQKKILDHILTHGDETETYYVEVKSDLNVRSKEGIAKIAKFLLGAANRDPSQASRHFKGYAVLVIGAQAGAAYGVERGTEPHELEDKLQPYLGQNFPEFELGRISIDDEREVLFIVAPPPEDGQPMFPCHQDFQGNKPKEGLTDGAIYVRGASNTRPARSGEILRLIERGQGSSKPPIDIDIELVGAVHRISHLSKVMEVLYGQEEQRYANRITRSQDSPEVDPYLVNLLGLGKPATPEQQADRLANWRNNMEENKKTGRDHLLGVALEGLGLRVVSHNRYIDQPHLLLTFENCMVIDHLDREDADWGTVVAPVVKRQNLYPPMNYEISPNHIATYPVNWENSGNDAEILLTPKAFRPNTRHEFDQDDYVLIARDHEIEEITGTWQLTEAENDEVTSGTFTVPLNEVIHAAELLEAAFSTESPTKDN